jgi:hypothetical protein
MVIRPFPKPVLALIVALALQGGALAAAFPSHGHRSVPMAMSDCGHGDNSAIPVDSPDDDRQPSCCGDLGLCPLLSAVTSSIVFELPSAYPVVFSSVTENGPEREIPPDPFPPRS